MDETKTRLGVMEREFLANMKNEALKPVLCDRCGGTGHFRYRREQWGYPYNETRDVECVACRGTGFTFEQISPPAQPTPE